MRRARSIAIVCAGLSMTFLSSGCSGEKKGNEKLAATAPVTGVVMYKGKPVKDAAVTFHPQGEGNPATGRTEENGRFILTTYKERDGAAVGFHTVTVQVMPLGGLPGQEVASTGAADVPAIYADPKTSKLTVEVKQGPNNLELKLED